MILIYTHRVIDVCPDSFKWKVFDILRKRQKIPLNFYVILFGVFFLSFDTTSHFSNVAANFKMPTMVLYSTCNCNTF